jgi:catechol 2,3-dioxygenase-like lactoylglutathione lyase family enzyme
VLGGAMNPPGAGRHDHMTHASITGILNVAVPVSDQDAAVRLFQRLGLETRFDAELQPGFRWIEMSPSAGGTTIALVPSGPDLPVGIDTGVRLATSDARAAHDAVRALGLDAGELLDWESAPLMFTFCDPDGNRFYVTETAD